MLACAKNTSVDGLVTARVIEARAGRVRLREWQELDSGWTPATLRLELDRFNPWGEAGYIGLKQLWECFARYCYLLRLLDDVVLQNAVREGIGRLDVPPA